MMRAMTFWMVAIGGLIATTGTLTAADTAIQLPLGRTGYQTNEWIDLAVIRSGTGPLTLDLTGNDGSKLSFVFAFTSKSTSRRTEHLHVNAWLLRPGHYKLEASVGSDRSDPVEIDIFSHVRKSDFKLINWGRARGKEQLSQGEDSLGFNVAYAAYSRDGTDGFIRAGLDFFSNCTMSGGHQMDLRMECDWSDPNVTRGGARRVVRQAFIDRTRGNTLGVHFYDEPGLTWHKHPETGEMTPHNIPTQVRAYINAFGKPPLSYQKVDPKNPEHVEQWLHWARWKLGFMDAAWKEAQFGVSAVRPDFLSLTQSQYGWSAPTDGYYFNVARSLPITSGHGGYHDVGCGYFYPGFVLEMARARDHWKPCWYLPTWYNSTTTDQFRMEQYLSFQTHVQGLMSPPDIDPIHPEKILAAQGVVESNRLMGKLGPIFNTMPLTKPPVALLYSLSNFLHHQVANRNLNYFHETKHFNSMVLTYLAAKLVQQPVHAVIEEDLLDGSVASDHKVILLTSLDYLDPKVIAALEDFVKQGGVVLMTGDCTVQIKGAVNLAVTPLMPDQKIIDELMATKKYDKLGPYTTTGKHLEGAAPMAKVLGPALVKAGIAPVLESDLPTISATRQAAGDIEYLFAVNATYDGAKNERNAVKAASGTLAVPADGRPVYDAILGGPVKELQAKGDKLSGSFRFGPGQMRVFARTARPIGSVQALTPVLTRQLVVEKEPIRVEIGATLLDNQKRVLSGSAPLHISVIDPLGATRHELYRATKMGSFNMSLPLAANDPAGEWTVRVRELLNNTEDTVRFKYVLPGTASALAGATPRAVFFGNDRDNIFRFARFFHEVTIVKGATAFHDAAAQRLTKALQPYGARCKMMDLAEAAKARSLSEEEAATWCGLLYAGKGAIKPGAGNPPALAGFAVQGPVILIGNPKDNPIIQFLAEQQFLPYKVDPNYFPGPERGLIAWQRDGVGAGQESITLIAHDEAGMNEAVGTLLEAVAGIEPLTRWALPQSSSIIPAKAAPGLYPAAQVAWTAQLPDRVLALKATDSGLTALTHDGSLATLDAQGKVTASKEMPNTSALLKEMTPPADNAAAGAAKTQARADRMIKLVRSGSGGQVAVTYWGGTLRIVDDKGAVKTEQLLPQDVTALTWQGNQVIAGLADGRVLALTVK